MRFPFLLFLFRYCYFLSVPATRPFYPCHCFAESTLTLPFPLLLSRLPTLSRLPLFSLPLPTTPRPPCNSRLSLPPTADARSVEALGHPWLPARRPAERLLCCSLRSRCVPPSLLLLAFCVLTFGWTRRLRPHLVVYREQPPSQLEAGSGSGSLPVNWLFRSISRGGIWFVFCRAGAGAE